MMKTNKKGKGKIIDEKHKTDDLESLIKKKEIQNKIFEKLLNNLNSQNLKKTEK